MNIADYVAVVTAVLAAAGLAYTARALKQAQIASGSPLVTDVLREFRGMADDRHLVLRAVGSYAPAGGFRGLPDEIRPQVVRVSHYVDSVGLLVAQGLADEKAVAGFIGDAVVPLWNALEPFIVKEREIRGGDYQSYFEHLAVLVTEPDPAKVRKTLKRFAR